MQIVIVCLIRIFNTFGFALQGLFANEFYPTVIRSMGSGFLYSCGMLGGLLTPGIIELSDQVNLNPYLLIGFLGLVGPLGGYMCKETFGKPLEDEIEEEKGL